MKTVYTKEHQIVKITADELFLFSPLTFKYLVFLWTEFM